MTGGWTVRTYQNLLQISVIVHGQKDLNAKNGRDDSSQSKSTAQDDWQANHLSHPSLPGREVRHHLPRHGIQSERVAFEGWSSHLCLGHMAHTPPESELLLATLPALCEYDGPENDADAIKDGEGGAEKVDQDTQACRCGQPLEVELQELKVVGDLFAKVVPDL